ncbi:MAG: hypothetical protein IJS71_06465 [Clostridia bacterium]|nr:hypothetical protein [Clostridia bacterium]
MKNTINNSSCEKAKGRGRRILIVLAAAVLTVLAVSVAVIIAVNNKKGDDPGNGNDNTKDTSQVRSMMEEYATFEELVSSAEVIVKGRFTGKKTSNQVYDFYTFKVIDTLYGKVYTKDIDIKEYRNAIYDVIYRDPKITYSPSDIAYKKGKDYYLILLDVSGPYYDKDTLFSVGGNIFLPADEIDACSVYGESLSKHSLIEESGTVHSIEEYLHALIDQGLLDKEGKHKNPYIRSSDFNTVIRNSDFILHVRFNEKTTGSVDNSRLSYLCTVVSSLKGDVEPGKTVEIIVPYGTLDTGDEVVLALFDIAPKSEAEPRNYKLSSSKSVFNVSEKGRIEKALQEISDAG